MADATEARVTGALRRALADLGVSDIDAAARLETWAALVATWNRKMDLSAARDAEELVDLLVADAAMLAPHIERGARVVDIGAGAGAPGLPLALLRPDLAVTLVEPLQKRIAFLRTAVGTLLQPPGAPRIAIERTRGEELARRGRRFDVAIARAVMPPPEWLELGAKLASDVWVLLARDEPPELAGARRTEDLRYRWPLTGAERRAVRYRIDTAP